MYKRQVPIPAPIIRMVWFTDSANKTGVQWQEGEKTVIMLDGTGIGETYLDAVSYTHLISMCACACEDEISEIVSSNDEIRKLRDALNKYLES